MMGQPLTSRDIVPWVNDFMAAQRKVWTDKGGELTSLPAEEQTAMLAKISSIGNDLSAAKPELKKAVDLVTQSAARDK